MLLSQLAATADTVLVRQVPPVRSTFEQVVFVASGLTSILLLVLLLLLVGALVAARAKADELRAKVDDLIDDLRPMAQKASAMSDDVREMAQTVNGMVSESRDTVHDANVRVRRTVRHLTARVNELGELIGRVNRSAERVATVASTAVGGIKLGARAFGIGRKKKPRATAGPRIRRDQGRPRK